MRQGKVTGRKRFGQTLQEKNIELEAGLAKNRFLASVSQLCMPLKAIIG